MDDHYFGRIRLRVSEYMHQLDEELWKLGISSKTKHNEAAPAQHELAPIFDPVNIACDHNQLTMELMRIVAKKNGLACLLHEKPFANVNGSGKHNNWSLSTDDGLNLLEPGKNPYENMQFLVMLCAIITAVDNHADLLRMAASVAGNDFRLGSSEAPPAIISIFLGEQLTDILYKIADGSNPTLPSDELLKTGVATLPTLKKDDSDRNRTSPFAFTGNKFEFRMVGSSASIACANYVLNAIVADSIRDICDRLESSADFDSEIRAIIADTVKNHGRIIFNGNNYTAEWVEEAERRGLPNLKNTVEAASALLRKENLDVLNRNGVLTEVECQSRYEIMLENFIKVITIEANTLLEMINRQVLPAIIKFAHQNGECYNSLTKAGFVNLSVKSLISKLSNSIDEITSLRDELTEAIKVEKNCNLEMAEYLNGIIKPLMEKIRACVDETEAITAADIWPMPTYTDLLHRV